jgi:hypothetical protein
LFLASLLFCSLQGFIIIFASGIGHGCWCGVVHWWFICSACCVVCRQVPLACVLNHYSLVCVVNNCKYWKNGARHPVSIQKQNTDDDQTRNWRATDAHIVHTKSLAAVIKYRTVTIPPLLLSLSLKRLQHPHHCW